MLGIPTERTKLTRILFLMCQISHTELLENTVATSHGCSHVITVTCEREQAHCCESECLLEIVT
jgi:hypothetical protein